MDGTLKVQSICNQGAIDLYSAASGLTPTGNFMLSPLSIVYATLMLYIGAEGKTKANLGGASHFTEHFLSNDASLIAGFSDTFTKLKVTSLNGSQQPLADSNLRGDVSQLALANAIFVNRTYKLSQGYLNTINRSLHAAILSEDFLNLAASRKDINDWANARTGGKINGLIPPGGVDGDTVAVLVNAVSFKASWANAFPISSTKKDDFTLLSGQKVAVEFMNRVTSCNYVQDVLLDLQYLEIPYLNRAASMLIYLPKKSNGLRELEKMLKPNHLRSLAARATNQQVAIALPRFMMRNTFDLKTLMEAIGVHDVFSSDADLTRMAPTGGVYVTQAFHKTFIDVNEKGTEAAAVSAIATSTRSLLLRRTDPVSFRADHPFMFAIRHNPTKLIIFMGRVESFR